MNESTPPVLKARLSGSCMRRTPESFESPLRMKRTLESVEELARLPVNTMSS